LTLHAIWARLALTVENEYNTIDQHIMITLRKRLLGPQVQIDITAETREECIQWRDYFFQWGAIRIAAPVVCGRPIDITDTLNSQEEEVDELRDGYHFEFCARKDLVIKAFRDSAEVKTDWEQVSEKGGKRGRIQKHLEIEKEAITRFESIPSYS